MHFPISLFPVSLFLIFVELDTTEFVHGGFFQERREGIIGGSGGGGATRCGIVGCGGNGYWYDVFADNVVKVVIENTAIGFGIVKVVVEYGTVARGAVGCGEEW
jgi:hypothetical protein